MQLTLRHPGGESTWLQGPVRIGRAPDNQLVLQDESLSRHHAEISLARGAWVIRDLQSANGLWLAGVRVPSTRLRSGDTITLGQVPLYVIEAHTGKPAEANKRVPFLIAAILALGFLALAPGREKSAVTTAPARDASIFLARTPPPPAQLTVANALAIAERNLKEGLQTGDALVSARHALAWARKLNGDTLPAAGAALQNDLDARLAKAYQSGRLAYVRAMKLKRRVEAEAAMRLLRETFPTDDPRSADLDRLEARWK